MPALRRFAAALSSGLLLQLSLLASGTLCPMQRDAGSAAMGAHSGHAAAGVRMPADRDATPRAGHAADHGSVGSPSTPNSCDATSTDSCGLPWAPGQQCTSMTSCTATPAAILATAAGFVRAHETLAAREPGSIVSNPAAAPELPPPRA